MSQSTLMVKGLLATWLTLATTINAQNYAWPYQTFVTEPDFTPPVPKIQKSGAPLADGLLMITPLDVSKTELANPEYFTSLIMTDEGQLIWNGPNPQIATNLKVQTLNGKSVLSYWSGKRIGQEKGYGKVTIMDNTYTTIYEVCPPLDYTTANGTTADCMLDPHESYITDRGTIIVTAVNETQADLSSVGGPVDGWIYDDHVLEIDIATNETLFAWSPLKAGVPLNLSKYPIDLDGANYGVNQSNAWDWFHMNSIQPVGDKYLVNSRHCWSSFLVDKNGNIEWMVDGSDGGDFTLPQDNLFRWQHHARAQNVTESSMQIHYFNNNNSQWDNGTAPSTGLFLDFDLQDKSVSVVRALIDPAQNIYSTSQGAVQPLDNGNVVMGYGSNPFIKEYGPNGDVRMTFQFGLPVIYESYRAFRNTWDAVPATLPKAAVQNGKVYMSWNGATGVTEWKVYAGAHNGSVLAHVGSVANGGFETSFDLKNQSAAFVQVVAYAGQKFLQKSAVVFA